MKQWQLVKLQQSVIYWTVIGSMTLAGYIFTQNVYITESKINNN